MWIAESEIREFVRECLLVSRARRLNESTAATGLREKFPFLGPDSVQLLSQFIWRFAADIAQKKTGESPAPPGEVKSVASDLVFSLGESLKDLVHHFVPDTAPKKKVAPPPPSHSTGSRPPAGAPVRKESVGDDEDDVSTTDAANEDDENESEEVDEAAFSDWPQGGPKGETIPRLR